MIVGLVSFCFAGLPLLGESPKGVHGCVCRTSGFTGVFAIVLQISWVCLQSWVSKKTSQFVDPSRRSSFV